MNVILIDDEQIALDFFQLRLKQMKDVNVVGAYVNPEKGMRAIFEKEVDVVFLDINLPGENGIALGKRITKEKPHVLIVYLTAFEHYAVDAFELNAVDYLVKPVRKSRMEETFARIRRKLRTINTPNDQKEEGVLRITTCPQFRIDGLEKPLQWRTQRVKELFILLLHHHDTVVHKEYIIELLWPNTNLEKATAQLYTTVYHVRRVLKEFGDHFRLKNSSSGYILFVSHVDIDIHRWEESLQSLPPLDSHTLTAYEQVMKQYPDSYLKDHHYVWAISEADRLDQKWIQIALDMGDLYIKNGDNTKSLEWYKGICTRYPEVEEAHFELMKCFAKEGKTAYVNYQYNTLVQVLEEELGVQPSTYVHSWYMDWQKQVGGLREIVEVSDE